MTTFNQAWAEYEARQAALKAEHAARRAANEAALAAHRAALHWCGHPAPIQIGACCPAEAYAIDSALGRNTD
jgi:hypothetical protein